MPIWTVCQYKYDKVKLKKINEYIKQKQKKKTR